MRHDIDPGRSPLRGLQLAILLLLAGIAFPSGPASGQCVIGVYADPAGTVSTVERQIFEPFKIYVVIRAEAAINGVSYNLVAPPLHGDRGSGRRPVRTGRRWPVHRLARR